MTVFKPVSYTKENSHHYAVFYEKAESFFNYISEALGDTREAAIAKTKIEECLMWASKGLAQKQIADGNKKDGNE